MTTSNQHDTAKRQAGTGTTESPAPHYSIWPTHWAGGNNSTQVDGHNTIWINKDGREVVRFPTEKGNVTQAMYEEAAFLCLAANSHEALVAACQAALAYDAAIQKRTVDGKLTSLPQVEP